MATRKNTAPTGAQSQSDAIRSALIGMEEISGVLLTVHRALNDDTAEERQTLSVADRMLTEVHDALERAKSADRVGTAAPGEPVATDPVAVSASGKNAGPVTTLELESAALRVAQATSTAHILMLARGIDADLQNALGLLRDYLDECASDLSELHRRHALAQEAQS